MPNLTESQSQLFRRLPDERFASLDAIWKHCNTERKLSTVLWKAPEDFTAEVEEGELKLRIDTDFTFRLNAWSFAQICKHARVHSETVGKVQPETARRILGDTLPANGKPLQLFGSSEVLRSIHGSSYTRLFNADVLEVVMEFASDFVPPQRAAQGGTGLYCGEQDMFCFLVDPMGWTEIRGQAFAPGFFVWNSEVGRRSVGIQTFWFQAVCQNHIVWDATHVVGFSRKHTTNVGDALGEIRRAIESLCDLRDEHRDEFVRLIQAAMGTRLGDMEESLKILTDVGFREKLAKEVLANASRSGALTVFSVVDALTHISKKFAYAGERNAMDRSAAQLFSLIA